MGFEIDVDHCRLCGDNTRDGGVHDFSRDIYFYDCGLCGRYLITFQAWYNVSSGVDTFQLRAATRQASEAGERLLLTPENIRRFAAEHAATSISGNLEKLLAFITRRCPRPSQTVPINAQADYPVIDAIAPKELDFFLAYAQELGFVKWNDGNVYSLTPKGWAHVRGDSGVPVPGRCFVAMAFRPELSGAFQDGIRAAIQDDCGFEAVRMLELEHNDKICDRIIVEIRRAQFIIADFTFHRGGVYFEAGFAQALGRPVIWTCKACHFKRLHFDTRQYNHIRWETADDLRKQLTARVRGTIPGARLT